jgi:hypothetical protein
VLGWVMGLVCSVRIRSPVVGDLSVCTLEQTTGSEALW